MERKAVFANQFYPGQIADLEKIIDGFLQTVKVKKINGQLKALLVPHAGYQYSGQVAAQGFSLLNQQHFKKVVVLGLSHQVYFTGLALAEYDHWQTPFGNIPLVGISAELKKAKGVLLLNEAHDQEHSVEVQLPFLQKTLGKFTLLPLVTGEIADFPYYAQLLNQLLDSDTLLLVSSDLSHYLTYSEAKIIDEITVKQIVKQQALLNHEQACNSDGINILLELAKLNHWQGKLLQYRNSGDVTGDKLQVVGYCSIAFYSKQS